MSVASLDPLTGFRKPAKPDDDVVAYVRQLELPLSEVAANRTGSEEALLLVASAHREMRHREASLAAHKKASHVVETLLCVSTAYQLATFARALVPYIAWMCTNRYSSHVLETMLSRLHEFLAGDDTQISVKLTAVHHDDSNGVEAIEFANANGVRASLVDSVVLMANELSSPPGRIQALLTDTSATHVVRALLCVLAGVSPSAQLNGAGGERQGVRAVVEGTPAAHRARGPAAVVTAVANPAATSVFERVGPLVAMRFRDAFAAIVRGTVAIADDDQGNTKTSTIAFDLACDVNAGPALQLALALASAGGAPAAGRFLSRRIINWGLEGVSGDDDNFTVVQQNGKRARAAAAAAAVWNDPAALPDIGASDASWVDDLAAHPVGSRALEAVLLHGDAPLLRALYGVAFAGRLAAMAVHPIANYAVQRVLVGALAPEQFAAAARELLPELTSLIRARREGVVWHIVAAAAGSSSFGSHSTDAALPASVAPGFVSGRCAEPAAIMLQQEVVAALVEAAGQPLGAEATVKPAAARPNAAGRAHLVRWWLDLGGYRRSGTTALPPPATPGAQLAPATLSPLGARIVAATLRLQSAASTVVYESLLALAPFEIALLAGDPYCSRHIVEPAFDAAGDVAWVRNRLFTALKGNFASLAAGRFSCWVVSKAFASVDVPRKSSLVAELMAAERALVQSHSARQVMRTMRVEHFRANRAGWEASFRASQSRAESMSGVLSAIAAVAPSAVQKSSRSSLAVNNGLAAADDQADTDAHVLPRAPKRQRSAESLPPHVASMQSIMTQLGVSGAGPKKRKARP